LYGGQGDQWIVDCSYGRPNSRVPFRAFGATANAAVANAIEKLGGTMSDDKLKNALELKGLVAVQLSGDALPGDGVVICTEAEAEEWFGEAE
jgi:hypothetical protein